MITNNTTQIPAQTFSVAPMMRLTNRHARYFLRLLTSEALLYTEMVTSGALLHSEPKRFLQYDAAEHPIALQLGGSEPAELAQCAKLAEQYGYDEINLNVGCPSERVQRGLIGACLMAYPDKVADCLKAMQEACSLPITVKHRIGIVSDEHNIQSYQQLVDFVGALALTGCKTFIVHARLALLKGLDPKQNRSVPPLCYDLAYQLKKDFPELSIILNGGITTLDQCKEHLRQVDGVMMGREAYYNPWLLAKVDAELYQSSKKQLRSPLEVLEKFYPYIDDQLTQGVRLSEMTRHILGLFNGLKGSKRFRRYLSEKAYSKEANTQTLKEAADLLQLD